MATSPDPLTRRNALEGIARAQKAGNIDIILSALTDPDPEVRSAAQDAQESLGAEAVFARVMDALCKAGTAAPPKAVNNALPYLAPTLGPKMTAVLGSDEGDLSHRKVAAYCLGRMQYQAATPELAKLVWSPDPVLAAVSANALLAIGSDAAYDCFRKLITHPSPELRWVAMQGVCRTGGSEAAKLLCTEALGTTETNLELRKRATDLLGKYGDRASIPVLIEILRSQIPLRRNALSALRQLTGLDAGGDAMSWNVWYQSTLPPTPEAAKAASAGAKQDQPVPTKKKSKSR